MAELEDKLEDLGLGGPSSHVAGAQGALIEEHDRRFQAELARIGKGGRQQEYDAQKAAHEKARMDAIIRKRGPDIMAVRNNPGSSSLRPKLECKIERGRNLFVFDAAGAPPVHFDMIQFAGCEPDYVPRLISAKLLQQWRLNGPWPSATDVSKAISAATAHGTYTAKHDLTGRYRATKAGTSLNLSAYSHREWLAARVSEVVAYAK